MPTLKDYERYIDLDSPDRARERENLVKQKRELSRKKAMLKGLKKIDPKRIREDNVLL
jgi:hypothetical protein